MGAGILEQLAAELRSQEAIAPYVRDSDEATVLGALVAAGPFGVAPAVEQSP